MPNPPRRSAFRNVTSITAKAVTAVVLVVGIYNNLHLISYNPFAGGSGPWQLETSNPLLDVNCTKTSTASDEHSSLSSQGVSAAPSFAWNTSRLKNKCFYVEDICHTSHRWFYRDSPERRQPDVLLHYESPLLRTYAGHVDSAYDSTYRFRKDKNDSYLASQRCVDSAVTNHLVLYSIYNEMLGEFYDRSLPFLWMLSTEQAWVRHAQLYLHLYLPNRRLMDSHHLFTNPFRTMPLLDFAALMDETSCQCLPRLIFCGYNVVPKSGMPRKQSPSPSPDPIAGDASNVSASATDGAVEIKPGKALTGVPTREVHRMLQRELRKALVSDNPHIVDDVRSFRDSILDEERIPDADRGSWRIVGLTQRSRRRVWRNLDRVIEDTSQALYDHKILLVNVNVEVVGFSPYQHVLWHAALDGLVGIHGAQLTEAIWMKPGSWVVELLPYVPEHIIMGSWTRRTNIPTPLGVIFDGTDLNHVGHPLQRDSAPYCYGLEGGAYEDCWKITGHPWDARDFLLESPALVNILLGTVSLAANTTECRDFQERAQGGFLVLYNIHCASDAGVIKLHHFYVVNGSLSGNSD